VARRLPFTASTADRPPSFAALQRWTIMVLAAALALLFSAVAQAQQYDGKVLSSEARAIAEKLACPVCEGESIAESHSDVAVNMRRRVQEMVGQGYTEAQILDRFVEDFGVGVLREPPKEGIGLGVWVVPPLMLLGGVGILALVLRAWRRQQSRTLPVDAALSDEEAESRVDSDLRHWEGRG